MTPVIFVLNWSKFLVKEQKNRHWYKATKSSYAIKSLITPSYSSVISQITQTVMAPKKISSKAAKAVEEKLEDVLVEEEIDDSDSETEVPIKPAAAIDSDSESDDEPATKPEKVKKAPKAKAKKPVTSEDDDDEGSDAGSQGSKRTRGSTNSTVSKAILDKMFDGRGDELKDFKKKDMKTIADLFVKTLVSQVMEGEKVTLTNHMTFKRMLRAERTHKVPVPKNKKGTEPQEVTKPAHFVIAMEVKPMLKAKFEALTVE